MAITYTWDISTVNTYPIKDSNIDVVHNVHWGLRAEDDANQNEDGRNLTASIYGTQDLGTDNISNFIAFENLDEAKVQSWVEASMGEDKITSMKSGLNAQITEIITPTSVQKIIGV
jgi:hypothetical protein